jgi:hypothetical protein
MTSPLYGLPELSGTTAERTATNLNFRYIESLFGSVPIGVNVSTPPVSPGDGAVYLINGTPTGIWTGKAGEVGVYTVSGWFYTTRHPNYTYGSGTWTETGGSGGGVALNTVNTFTRAQGSAPVALTDGATINTDASLSNTFTVTLGGNRTLANPTNLEVGFVYNWHVTQDGTGGRTLAYGTLFDWGTNGVPTLSTGVGTTDWISAQFIGGSLRAVIAKGY